VAETRYTVTLSESLELKDMKNHHMILRMFWLDWAHCGWKPDMVIIRDQQVPNPKNPQTPKLERTCGSALRLSTWSARERERERAEAAFARKALMQVEPL